MMAMMGVPILSIFIAPAAAAGLLLPMYILADVYAVWLFRGHYSARNLKILIPASALGIFVAFLLISRVPVEATKLAGVIEKRDSILDIVSSRDQAGPCKPHARLRARIVRENTLHKP